MTPPMKTMVIVALLALSTASMSPALAADGTPNGIGAFARAPGTAAQAKAFVAAVDTQLRKLWVSAATADWIKATYITDDTERNDADVNERVMAFLAQAQKIAPRFLKVKGL